MYEPQLSDFVRFRCIFCMVSFTRRVRIAGARFGAACNSVNRTYFILRNQNLLSKFGIERHPYTKSRIGQIPSVCMYVCMCV